jgi:hypothetical protein
MEACNMDASSLQKALLDLRKQISALIASEEAADPAAADEGHAEAAEAMADAGMGDVSSEEMKPEPTDVQSKFLDYMKPKVRPRRPGTGVINDVMAPKLGGGKEADKKAPGRSRKEAS